MVVSMRTQGTASPAASASPWAGEKIRDEGSGLVQGTNRAPFRNLCGKIRRAGHKAIARKTMKAMGSKSVRKKLEGGSSAANISLVCVLSKRPFAPCKAASGRK